MPRAWSGDSISMGGDPHSDPATLAGNPGGYGNYVLRLLTGHNIVSVQHNGGPVQPDPFLSACASLAL